MTEMQLRRSRNRNAGADESLLEQTPLYNRPESDMSGMNFILRSAFLRMTLVATSTVVMVTAFALLAIGLSHLLAADESMVASREPVVQAAAGVLLLATSAIQFVCVCVWSGWCSILPRQGFQALHHQNQVLVNGQLVTVQENITSFSKPPTLKTTPVSTGLLISSDQNQAFVQNDLLIPSPATSAVADASTSTRGDLHHLPSRIYAAPIALQEEITPSLRSSFQSFDDI